MHRRSQARFKISSKVERYFEGLETRQKESHRLRTILLGFPLVEELKWSQPCHTLEGKNVGIMRDAIAADICQRAGYLHQTVGQAADYIIHTQLPAQHGDGGVIVFDGSGHFAEVFNTRAFWRGWVGADGVPHVELFR